MGDIEKLRQAREAMSNIYPLTPAMWQEWAKDEISLGTGYILLALTVLLFELLLILGHTPCCFYFMNVHTKLMQLTQKILYILLSC